MAHFIIAKDIVSKIRRFNLTGRKIQFKLQSVPQEGNPVEWIKDGVEEIFKYATTGLQVADQMGISFCDNSFKRGPGWINFKPVGNITFNDLWDLITRVYQSNSAGLGTESFCIEVTSVRMPAGRGRARKYNSFSEECASRRGIVSIDNKDNLCLPRALVVAIAYSENTSDYRKTRRNIGKLQNAKVTELMQAAGVTIPEDGAGVPELRKFQEYLEEYKIIIYEYDGKGREIIFEGPDAARKINLLYHNKHYNVITSLTAAFCCSYYCEECHVAYDTKNKHRCGGTCPCCQQSPACSREWSEVTCEDCNRKFRGSECYIKHRAVGSLNRGTVCEQIKRCTQCLKTVRSNRKHICGEVYCKTCMEYVPAGHLCFMQPDTRKPKTEGLLFVFYDLETRQEQQISENLHLHEPNLCISESRCNNCLKESNLYFCQKCEYRTRIFKYDVVENFMQYLLTIRKKFKKVVVIAHNGQAFDHQFLLNYILRKSSLKPELIMRGSKIILMEIGNMKFIDSLNYFPMPLAALPKAFDLGSELKKGYFPHLFNKKQNENYIGPLPETNYYCADHMKAEDREKFMQWYNEHKNDIFDMQKEIVEYCKSDVNILTQACLKFRDLFLTNCSVDPFTEACTVASACNLVFRRNFLQPNTIGIIPKNGYRWRDNQSNIAIQWMLWEERQRSINIIHAAKQQEMLLNGVKVDGYSVETNKVFEFHGCYFHGCIWCYTSGRDVPLHESPQETFDSRYEFTMAKSERLRQFGYEVIEMWECQFTKMLKDNPEIMKTIEDHPLLVNVPLNPRDAFYGGRTGNTRQYHKCHPEEKIKYVDVCSLYPWVCKYGKFPVGHPKVYVGDDDCRKLDLKDTDGLIKCTILPPQNLYHPVLPMKANNKLMFVLCRVCADTMQKEECFHTENERALTGTWVIDEVRKAIDKGYEIINIHEVWSYDTEKYDPFEKTGGLFTGMMNKFIKLKQQASGWPSQYSTQKDREQYMEDFLNNEGVRLDCGEMIKNAGLRSLAKLILNSFWGKLGQRENQPKTSIINQPSDLYAFLTNPSIDVNHILPINEETIIVNWGHKEGAYDTLSTVNVCIAAYVTTQARLKLYNYLEQLEDRVLYYDTDSVIYIARDGEWDVPTGNFLGDMTDELEEYGAGSYITEFVSGGPKNYSYKVHSTQDNQEHVVCKVKGLCLNYAASKLVNFDSIKELVLKDSGTDSILVTSDNIERTKDHMVITKQQIKTYRPNSTKRKFLDNFNSVPYGFKRSKGIESGETGVECVKNGEPYFNHAIK